MHSRKKICDIYIFLYLDLYKIVEFFYLFTFLSQATNFTSIFYRNSCFLIFINVFMELACWWVYSVNEFRNMVIVCLVLVVDSSLVQFRLNINICFFSTSKLVLFISSLEGHSICDDLHWLIIKHYWFCLISGSTLVYQCLHCRCWGRGSKEVWYEEKKMLSMLGETSMI